ncbi:MAG: hypothetical protein NW208_03325 [Bryobacter sp.]|nr:hypothetical protein [Bryobacter sp.]
MPPRWLLASLWALLLAFYFYKKAPVTFEADWSHDDLMNCYRALESSYADTIQDIIVFWKPSPFFRPLGQLFYKLNFDNFQFAQLPPRIALSAILLFNAYLLGFVAFRLSGNLAYGLAAAALATYHPMWAHLYLNSGTVYEILAFTFVYLGLLLYVELRNKPWADCIVLPCFILALNAKESGIVLAPIVLLYELVYHRRIPWRISILFAGVGVAFILGRVYGPGGLSGIGSYQPEYTLSKYLTNYQHYFGSLILQAAAPLWACLLLSLVPLLSRTKEGLFATLLFPIGILPLAFVPDRGLEAVYVACGALAFGIPSFLLLLRKERFQLVAAACILLALAVSQPALRGRWGWENEQNDIRAFHEQLRALVPQMPSNVQIRFEKEPFTADTPWASIFATRLAYRDLTIRVAGEHNPHGKDYSRADDFLVFTWEAGKLKRIK